MNEIIEAGRSLEQVTNGIRILTAQTVANICQIGKLLTEAKAMVGHGGWGAYLEKEVSYSQSTANNFMRLYDEYGEFGPNSQTFGNLSASQALALLALPAGEREEFAESHDVESMSVRDLKAQIAAEKERAEKAETDTAALREQLAVAQEEIGAVHQKAADWQQRAKDWQDKNAEDKKIERKLRADVTALETELAAARAQAGKLPPAEMSRLRDEILDEAVKVTEESHRAELAGKDDRIAELEVQLREAEVAAITSNDVAAAKILIKTTAVNLGEDANRLHAYYLKYKSNSQLSGAIRKLVIRQIEIFQQKFDIEPV